VHIERDLIGHHLIVSGLVPPQGPPQDEADRQLALSRRNIVLLANSFTEAAFLTVIDDVVISPGSGSSPAAPFGFYPAELRARPIHFVQLTPSIEIVRARDAGRHKQVLNCGVTSMRRCVRGRSRGPGYGSTPPRCPLRKRSTRSSRAQPKPSSRPKRVSAGS